MKESLKDIVVAAVAGALTGLILLFILDIAKIDIGRPIYNFFNSSQEEEMAVPSNPPSSVPVWKI